MALSFLPDDFEVLEIPKPNWESPLQYAVTIRIVEPLPIPKMHTIRYLIVLEAYVENEKLYNKVSEYLKQYAKAKGYKIVLTYSKSNPSVLYADESLDITKAVVEGLNVEHKKDKK